MDPILKPISRLGMDYVFIGLLFSVSTTGFALLFLQETTLLGLMLAIHLGIVYAFFLVLPFDQDEPMKIRFMGRKKC
jgi:citrate/tricarballylate utilization protein